MSDHRRAQRKPPAQVVEVTDMISGKIIGRVGNLSIDGMLLIGPRALPTNALFQVSFNLPGTRHGEVHRMEVGLHEQWGEPANVPGQHWCGFRIIDISPEDQLRLEHWIETKH